MKTNKTLFIVVALVSIGALCGPKAASAQTGYHRQTIQNDTGGNVNDLRLYFTGKVGRAKIKPRVQPPGQDAEGVPMQGGECFEFAQNTFGTIAPQDNPNTAGRDDRADIDYCTNSRTTIVDGELSYWTLDGENVGKITKIGQPMEITKKQFGHQPGTPVFATFFNPEPFAVVYTKIALYRDNDLSNYNFDDFSIPTGPLVAGLPEEMVLQPGEVVQLSFGDVDLSKYQLAMAEVAPVDDPENRFSFVSAAFLIGPANLTLTPSTVPGCKNVTGKVTLDAPAPAGGAVVDLSNTNSAANVPVSVTVPAGAISKTFTITTTPVTAIQTGTVTATYNGESVDKTLTVRPIAVKSLTLSPNPVVGGNSVMGTVTLECAAAPGDIVVKLWSANPAVASPTVDSITIPAGSKTGSFTVNTADVDVLKKATIKARAENSTITKGKTLTVNP